MQHRFPVCGTLCRDDGRTREPIIGYILVTKYWLLLKPNWVIIMSLIRDVHEFCRNENWWCLNEVWHHFILSYTTRRPLERTDMDRNTTTHNHSLHQLLSFITSTYHFGVHSIISSWKEAANWNLDAFFPTRWSRFHTEVMVKFVTQFCQKNTINQH